MCSSRKYLFPSLPPMEGNRNSEGWGGGQKEANSKGVGVAFRVFFLGGLSKIVKLLINNIYLTRVSKQILLFALIIFTYGRLDAFFTAYAIVFFNTIVIGS